jgi:DNA-binding LytR/AlgR family response regulator
MTMNAPSIRTLIVDDEPVAREVLVEELSFFRDVEVIGEAGDGAEALGLIERLKPDLVLLDIQMPGLGGFDVIRQLPKSVLPVVVIVTAYDQHAVDAFEAGAVDYLLKPVTRDRLEKALARARFLRGRLPEVAASLEKLSDGASTPDSMPYRSRKVAGRSGEEYHLISLDDVLAFQAEREIVWIITARQRLMATHPLREIDARLRGPQFHRVHRNALVNVNHVRKMTPLSSQRWLLTLSNGQEFIVSKRQARDVRKLLQW